MVLPLSGGAPVELLTVVNGESITNPTWMPNSRDIIYAHNDGNGFKFELNIISSIDRSSKNLGVKMNETGITGLSIHPDGKNIAFTTNKISFNEVWVVKDFLPILKIETEKGKIKQ